MYKNVVSNYSDIPINLVDWKEAFVLHKMWLNLYDIIRNLD